MTGGARRNRTADLVIANDALSQLSYGPDLFRSAYLDPGSGQVKRYDIRVSSRVAVLNLVTILQFVYELA